MVVRRLVFALICTCVMYFATPSTGAYVVQNETNITCPPLSRKLVWRNNPWDANVSNAFSHLQEPTAEEDGELMVECVSLMRTLPCQQAGGTQYRLRSWWQLQQIIEDAELVKGPRKRFYTMLEYYMTNETEWELCGENALFNPEFAGKPRLEADWLPDDVLLIKDAKLASDSETLRTRASSRDAISTVAAIHGNEMATKYRYVVAWQRKDEITQLKAKIIKCGQDYNILCEMPPAAGMYTEARFADVTCSGHKRFSCPPLTTASPVANATTVTNAVNTTTVTNAVNTTMAIATTASSPSAVVGDDTQSSGSQESSATVSSPTVATSKGGLDMNLILYIVVPVAGALLLGGLLLLVVCIVQRKRKDTMDVSDKQVQVKTTVKNATVKVTNSLWIDVDNGKHDSLDHHYHTSTF